MRYKNFVTLLFVGLLALPVHAQIDKRSAKNMKKASRYVKKEKYDKASERVQEVIRKYPVNMKLWDYYQEIHSRNYKTNYLAYLNDSATVAQLKDPLTSNSKEALAVLERLKTVKKNYLNAMYDASLYVPFNMKSAGMMRVNYIDPLILDETEITINSERALEEATEALRNKNYQTAIAKGREAVALDSNNYQALCKIGRAYYQLGYYQDAIRYFKQTIAMEGRWSEPHNFLADAMNRKGNKSAAFVELKESLLICPEESTFIKMSRLLELGGTARLNRQWVLRLWPIASVGNRYDREPFFIDALHFAYYAARNKEVELYYAESGVKKEGSPAALHRYLEIECWNFMLEKTQNEDLPALDYAREMKLQGQLESYVFIALFNVDLYSQFTDYITNHREEAQRFIDNYLIAN